MATGGGAAAGRFGATAGIGWRETGALVTTDFRIDNVSNCPSARMVA